MLAAAQGHANVQIASDLGINVDTVRLWRDRWAEHRPGDAPQPGVMPKFTTEQRCQMAALACEAPVKVGRPISQWTGREIADGLSVFF